MLGRIVRYFFAPNLSAFSEFSAHLFPNFSRTAQVRIRNGRQERWQFRLSDGPPMPSEKDVRGAVQALCAGPVTHGSLLNFPRDPLACMRQLRAAHGPVAALE